MTRRYSILVSVLFLMIATGAGCGQAQDRPQDCRESEFYNDQTGRCNSCPVVTPPECAEGCGWEVYEGENGCKRARCAPNCRACEVGQKYDRETGLCTACPGVPDCQELVCDGALRIVGDYRGACPEPSAYACGECTQPHEECDVADDGRCIDPSE